jgi:hypothetical protein
VSQLLREHFVLHWQSVRPVPKLTIDFGDGRKMERTLTGNSIHYVMDSDGRVIDALPGMYGPGAFRRELERISGCSGPQTPKERAPRRYHAATQRTGERLAERRAASWASSRTLARDLQTRKPASGSAERSESSRRCDFKNRFD